MQLRARQATVAGNRPVHRNRRLGRFWGRRGESTTPKAKYILGQGFQGQSLVGGLCTSRVMVEALGLWRTWTFACSFFEIQNLWF
jgi:hypothetical protein